MEGLFQAWEKRESSSSSLVVKEDDDDENKMNSIDKNSRMLLKNILITNKKYMKEEIPPDYKYDDTTGDFIKIDVTNQITPFTTDKNSLYDSLEIERQEYLSKSCSNKSTSS